MTAGAVLWTKLAGWTAFAAVSYAVVHPAGPPSTHSSLAFPAAVAAGVLLFAAVDRSVPRLMRPRVPRRVGLARGAILLVLAVNEEVIWRRVALGEGLAVSPGFALAVSSVGFAFTHRTQRSTHLVTGGVFGLIYLATGALLAAVATHVVYNLLVAAAVDAARAPTAPMPP